MKIQTTAAIALLFASLLAEAEPFGFSFEEGEFPQSSVFGSDVTAQPRGESVSLGTDTERTEGAGVCLTTDPSRGGVFVRNINGTEVMGESLSALTLAVAFRSTPVSPSPVFVERLVNSSSSNAGFFRFRAQRNGGDDDERAGTLRFAFMDQGSKVVNVSSSIPWVQTAGAWNWVGFVFNEGKATFYLNGERLGDEVELPVKSIPGAEGVKHYVRAGYGFSGAFDDLFILPNQALNEEQMRTLYQKGMHDESLKSQLQ